MMISQEERGWPAAPGTSPGTAASSSRATAAGRARRARLVKPVTLGFGGQFPLPLTALGSR